VLSVYKERKGMRTERKHSFLALFQLAYAAAPFSRPIPLLSRPLKSPANSMQMV